MGYTDISTTQKYYCTVDEDHRTKAAAVQNKILDFDVDRSATDLKMTFSGDFASNSGNEEKVKVIVSEDYIDSYKKISPCLLLYFKTDPMVRPIREHRFEKYKNEYGMKRPDT